MQGGAAAQQLPLWDSSGRLGTRPQRTASWKGGLPVCSSVKDRVLVTLRSGSSAELTCKLVSKREEETLTTTLRDRSVPCWGCWGAGVRGRCLRDWKGRWELPRRAWAPQVPWERRPVCGSRADLGLWSHVCSIGHRNPVRPPAPAPWPRVRIAAAVLAVCPTWCPQAAERPPVCSADTRVSARPEAHG